MPARSVARDRDEIDVERVAAQCAPEHAPGSGLGRRPSGRACRSDAPSDAELDVAELQAGRLIARSVAGRALAVGRRECRSDDRWNRLTGRERGEDARRDAGCRRCRDSLRNGDEVAVQAARQKPGLEAIDSG
jgi:hypothetical protein